jgi:hypothetical protein
MAAVAARYGESGPAAYLLPVSVDGLIVVASVCLVELSHHLAAGDTTTTQQAGSSVAAGATSSAAGTRSPAASPTRGTGSAMFGEVRR